MLRGAQPNAAAIGVALGVPLNNTLGGDVALNNATYATGPTVAQGTTGTWFAVGTITLSDSAVLAQISAKLWDGTTVIASSREVTNGTQGGSITLAGFITNPAGNLRISAISNQAATSTMAFNGSGNSKDCTLTVHRVG